jgi:hypothetical protein
MDAVTRLEEALATCPSRLELTSDDHLDRVRDLAELFLDTHGTAEALAALGARLSDDGADAPLMAHLAFKLAASRRFVRDIGTPTHVSVVFAVYKEHNRIRTSAEHPNGEDFLARKVAQLRWLFHGNPNMTWDLRLVDDGDPEKTGEIAQRILSTRMSEPRVDVLFLADAIDRRLAVTAPMTSASESNKGGAILYGMWDAVQVEHPNHIVIFTDADLSTHLGQSGLLLKPLLEDAKLSAIGSRREPDSVVIKGGARNHRGKLFIYLWKRMLSVLETVVDSQCGFKAFRADVVRQIVLDSVEKRFAFDLELLLKTQLIESDSIAKVGVAWIDSEAESTTTDLQPYLPMLQCASRLYRTYLPQRADATAFADFVDGMNEATWAELLDDIPEAITSRDPSEFSEFAGVSVDDLRR